MPSTKKKIRNAHELPTHTYELPGTITKVLAEDEAFISLLTSVRKDIEADLRKYDISDKGTLRNYYKTLLRIAILEQRFDHVEQCIDSIKSVEEKEAAQLICGVVERALLAAHHASSDGLRAFSATLESQLAALSYPKIETELKTQKRRLEVFSLNLWLGIAEEQLDPATKDGKASFEIATKAIEIKYLIDRVLPFRDSAVQIFARLAVANRTTKPDIWPQRDVRLSEADNLEPVIVGIWDSGTDLSLFPGRIFHDENGESGTGFSWRGDPVSGLLREVQLSREELIESKAFMKGLNDMRADIDSTEASALRSHLASLTKERVKAFLEGLQFYLEYAHGTHVAGIVAQGNPAIRLLVGRIEWPYQMVIPAFTQEWADRHANALCETIEYFRSHSVRVANLSWSCWTTKEIEHNLELNAPGGSSDERRGLALRFFETISKRLKEAIVGTPDILFVTATGNTNSDIRFDEQIPGCFDLPNIISVGAVDKAGDETPFTSVGRIDIYANGYEVESVVPGGEKQTWSGTSMAAPQVSNLAAKLLAKYPNLTAAQVKDLILAGATVRVAPGDREIRLLSPKRSFELAMSPMRA